LRKGFLRIRMLSPVSINSSVLHTTRCSYQKDNRAKPANLPERTFENRRAIHRKLLSHFWVLKIVLWLTRLVAGLSPRRLGFDPSSLHVRFFANMVTLEQVFLRVLLFYPVNIILPMLHTYLNLQCRFYVLLSSERRRAKSGNFPKAMFFRKSGSTGDKSIFALCLKGQAPLSS
jgi:hypothetical protein